MGPFPATVLLLLLLAADSFAIPTVVLVKQVSQRLTGPALLVLDSAEGLMTSRLQPGRFSPVEDPTNSLVCKHLQSEFTPYFVPRPFVPYIKQRLLARSILQDESVSGSFLSDDAENMPWVVFSRTSDPLADPWRLRIVNLQLISGGIKFNLPAYSIVYKTSDLGIDDLVDYPEDVLASPPPLFPSLCVSPEKPRPFPVLFAASPSQTYPSVAYFSIAGLNPYVVTKRPAVEAAQPTFFKSYSYDVFCSQFGTC